MNESNAHDVSKMAGDAQTSKNVKTHRGIRKVGKLISERWPEYLLEIIVVIIGITISFAINNYQTDATNRSLEQTYLGGLLLDMSSDINELEEVIVKTRTVVENCERLIDASRSHNGTLTAERFVRHVMAIGERPSYISKNATFSGLKSSGSFNLISDNTLKTLLFEHDAQYQAIKTLEVAELQVVVGLMAPYILRYVPIDEPAKGNPEALRKVNVQSILKDVEFINNVILRRDNRDELLKTYEETLSIAREIERKLKENIH